MIFAPGDLYAYIAARESLPALARIMTAAALAESGGDTDALGDYVNALPTSRGLFQINDIHGLTPAQRHDPDYAVKWMRDHEFEPAYSEGLALGYQGEELARWTCMRAERPSGWNGVTAPGLYSAAAERYAERWRALGDLSGASPVSPPPAPPAPTLQERLNLEVSYSNALLADCIRPALQALREYRYRDAYNALVQAEERPAQPGGS